MKWGKVRGEKGEERGDISKGEREGEKEGERKGKREGERGEGGRKRGGREEYEVTKTAQTHELSSSRDSLFLVCAL